MKQKHLVLITIVAMAVCFNLNVRAAEASPIILIPDNFTNTLVVAGESFTQTMFISNVGYSEVEFSFCPQPLARIPAFKDTFITEHDGYGGATSTHGTNALILVHAIAGLHRTHPIVSFNLTSLAGRTVKGSTVDFVIYIRSGWGWNHVSQSVSVRESLVDWDEMSTSYANFGGVGFNGALHTGGSLATQTVTYNGETEPVIFKIPSSVVQRWIDDPSSNKGLFLISNTTATRRDMSFWSRETGPAPQLSFELEGGEDSDGLVAHYPFNGNAADETGNGHDGAVNGAALTEDRFGNTDSAYDFNGSSDHINCGNIIDGFDSFSVSAWVNIDSFTDTHYMGPWSQTLQSDNFSQALVGTYAMFTASNTSGGFGTVMRLEPYAGVINTRVGHVLPLGEWCLVTQVYDGNEIHQYHNGELVNTTHVGPYIFGNTWDFLIGQTAAYPSFHLRTAFFDGRIDDLRIYNRALSDMEIQELYSPNSGDGLIAHYPFNGNTVDESGNGHDGVVHGATLAEDRFGNPNSAYVLDGVDDYMDMGTLGGIRSVSMWIKQEPRNGFDFYFGHTDFRLFASTAENGRLTMADGTSALYTTVHMDDHIGQWNHFVALSDGMNSKLYFNGNDVTLSSGDLKAVASNLINVGRWPGPSPSATHYLNGSIDDLRLYNRALSSEEIAELYNERDGDGLVASYPFSGNAVDESGNGHDGMVDGAILTEDRFGNPDSAYEFDGVDDHIEVMDSPNLRLGNTDYSISTWFYETEHNSSALNTILAKRNPYPSNQEGWLYGVTGEDFAEKIPGKLRLFVSGGDDPYSTGNAILPLNEWHHAVLTYDLNSKTVRFYVDGVLDAVQGNMHAPNSTTSMNMFIGRDSRGDNYAFHGKLDDIQIYNRALSESEIAELYSETPVQECTLPEWLSVEPKSGIIPAGSSIEVTLTLDAAGMVAGDYVSHTLDLFGSDSTEPIGSIPVSMWVIPQVPVMDDEPCCTAGESNEVMWSMQDGAVEYWVEAVAVEHCSPGRKGCSKCSDGNPVPLGWLNQNRFKNNPEWNQQSGWVATTNYVFTDLRLNTKYAYRVKASVVTEDGRLEGEWSEVVESCQLPHLRNADCVPDWWKEKHFGKGIKFDAWADPDGDGECNLDEYIAGRNPHDRKSTFKIKGRKPRAEDGFVLEWDCVTGRVYSVYWSGGLGEGFQLLEDGIRYPQGSYTDTVHNAESGGFYKVDVNLDE